MKQSSYETNITRMKVTTIAPANIAFIKYWSKKPGELFLPNNNSISMTMSGCTTKTTIELTDGKDDVVEVKFYGQDFKQIDMSTIKNKNIYRQIYRIRNLAGSKKKIRLRSENNFPADAGIASSASGFAALTAALLLVYGLKEKVEDKVELSRQIRLCGSGSSVRSAFGGFVEFEAGHDHESSHAIQITDEKHWKLVDIVAIVNSQKKKYGSSEGHTLAESSPYLKTRLIEMQDRIKKTRQAIIEKDLNRLGPLIEEDSISMHAVMMTSKPPLFYWEPGTIAILKEVMKWRDEGLMAYCTVDAGPNVHVICEKKDAKEVEKRLKENEYVKQTIYNEPCEGVKESQAHLF